MRVITRLLLLFFTAIITLNSCDDGDIIVTTFDFDSVPLQNCGERGDYVFYKINNENLESISLVLGTTDDIFLESGTRTYDLNGTSDFVNYRTYSDQVDDLFFCSNVTPSEPAIIQDFSGNSGTAELDIIATNDDNDGVVEPVDDELDTDGDGIPNYIDFDDDGDNVPTENELDTENADGDDDPLTNPKDTDGDGIPDYLDDDDDGDGVLTRNEDSNQNNDPADDVDDTAVGPNFLNPAIANEFLVNSYRQHSFTLVTSVTVTLRDLVLSNGTEELIRQTLGLGTIDNAFQATFRITPVFNVD